MTRRNPLRRLADQVVLTSMRPPILPALLNRPNRETIDLEGKRVLLTGASSGIGEAAAEKLARRGATVVAVARRQDLLDELVTRITNAGGDARAHVCDLADLHAVLDHLPRLAAELADIFLTTSFEGGRHQTRIELIENITND